MEPISNSVDCPVRQYRTITYRPITESGTSAMRCWLTKETWILKTSKPGEWYSKVKRMTGQTKSWSENILVEELIGLTDTEQAEKIVEHYYSRPFSIWK